MNTTKCRDCGKAVSHQAKACPHCGGYWPGSTREDIAKVYVLAAIVCLFMLGVSAVTFYHWVYVPFILPLGE